MSTLKVLCNKKEGVLDFLRYTNGKKSKCIRYKAKWMTPQEFGVSVGIKNIYRWRKSIKSESGETISSLIANWTQSSSTSSSGGGGSSSSSSTCSSIEDRRPKKVDVALTKPLEVKTEDIDPIVLPDSTSYSGVPQRSDSKALARYRDIVKQEPLCTTIRDPNSNPIDYFAIVKEAIENLTYSKIDCTTLNILLYIINYSKPLDEMTIIYRSVKKVLRTLTRIGFLNKTDSDGESESDDDEIAQDYDPKPIIPVGRPKKSSSTDNVSSKPKSLSVKKANLLKAKARKKLAVAETGKRVVAFLPKKLSPPLAALCGAASLTRQETLKRIWIYVKYCKLQDPEQKTQINCDEKMFAVFQKRRIDQKEMMPMLKKNMS